MAGGKGEPRMRALAESIEFENILRFIFYAFVFLFYLNLVTSLSEQGKLRRPGAFFSVYF